MRYDATTALIVVDVQNDFAHPDGALCVPGGEAIIGSINREIEAARRGGATIVYTQDWHPESTPHFESDGGLWPVHCVRDTWGAEFHSDLEMVDDPIIIRKGVGGADGYSAFSVRDPLTLEEERTGLGILLWQRKITRVFILGLTEDGCVKETALDATRMKLVTTVITDGTAPNHPRAAEDAREAMGVAGVRLLESRAA